MGRQERTQEGKLWSIVLLGAFSMDNASGICVFLNFDGYAFCFALLCLRSNSYWVISPMKKYITLESKMIKGKYECILMMKISRCMEDPEHTG